MYKRTLYLCFFAVLLFRGSLYAQIGILGNIYIAPDTELHLAGTTFFESGYIISDKNEFGGVLSFAKDSAWEGASNASHVDGYVRIYNTSDFTFPVGDGIVFQPISLYNFSGADYTDITFNNQNDFSHQKYVGILKLSDRNFWQLRNSDGQGQVVLDWNSFSNLSALLSEAPEDDKQLEMLGIGGFDGTQWLQITAKIDQSSIDGKPEASISDGAIQSDQTIDFSTFRVLTLIAKNTLQLDQENIYEAITPNGDGKNDFWIIKGIENFPNSKVNVFNRWGETVFEATQGYKNNWNGHYKDGSDILPNGPYFYIIDLDADGKIDNKGWIYITD